MRKTIFALALFTVILSFYVSKAELFLEDVELVEFEDEELITTKPSKGSDDKKDKTKTPTKDDKKDKTPPKKDKTPPKKDKTPPKKDKTPPKKSTKPAPKKSSTMKWVIIAVVVVLVGVAIWYFACRGDDTEAKKDKAFKEGKKAEDH